MKTKIMLLLLCCTLLLGGCGDIDYTKMQMYKQTSEKSLLEDTAALSGIIEELENLPELKGKQLKIFQTIEIYESIQKVEIAKDKFQDRYISDIKVFLLKPGTDKEAVKYNYSSVEKKWIGPTPVKVIPHPLTSLSGKKLDEMDYASNMIPLKNLRLETLPGIYNQLKEKSQNFAGLRWQSVKTDLQNKTLTPYWKVAMESGKDNKLVSTDAAFDFEGNLIHYNEK